MPEIQILVNNHPLTLIRLKNSSGAYIDVLNLGATLVSVVVPDRHKQLRDVILKYDEITDYLSDEFYMGSTIGRVANRISKAKFKLDGEIFYLEQNDGFHSNHGGFSGFNNKVFDYKIHTDEVVFSLQSYEGEGGYPGNVKLNIFYSLSNKNEVIISYKIISDKKTPINLTNHAYFNLSGEENILNHVLEIEADTFLEMNSDFTPSGKILKTTENPAYYFDGKSTIQDLMKIKKEEIEGYNSYLIARNRNPELKKLAILEDNTSGIKMNLYTTMPGCMLYTGDYLSHPFAPFAGVCLEAQHYPDAPNHDNFPDIFLEDGEIWEETIVYAFNY